MQKGAIVEKRKGEQEKATPASLNTVLGHGFRYVL
jgi:hypothetical protein